MATAMTRIRPWKIDWVSELSPKNTSEVGMVERKPTLSSSIQKLPRPPASEMPARITAAMMLSCMVLPEPGLNGPAVAANSTAAKPTKPPAAMKMAKRVALSEMPRALAAARLPPTAVARRP